MYVYRQFPLTAINILGKSTRVEITSNDTVTSLPCNAICITSPQYTFESTENLRIKISITELKLINSRDFLEFGDGLISNNSTQLARFSGTAKPEHVTSVSNAAWLNMHVSCSNETFTLLLEVEAEESSRKICLYLTVVYNKE